MIRNLWSMKLAIVVTAMVIAPITHADVTVSGKYWDLEVDDGVDSGSGELIGVEISADLSEGTWVHASYMDGDFEGDNLLLYGETDVEVLAGISKGIFDIGGGVRYTEDADLGGPTSTYGPAVYIGAEDAIGSTPLGWYANASWMFYDVNDDWDWGEHIDLEAGVSATISRFIARVGYRYKTHYDRDPDSLTYEGVIGAIGYSF